ncbi:hypothetical protein DFH29DRAFT_874074 [Suillus ampliporus]|nr:hypothetical protein DFH29DRAFT_874074 [Suillus ampliporus]
MGPTYLYVHESNEVFVMVQLEHKQCDELSKVEQPWLQKLGVVGVLGIPDNAGVIHDHPLFEETVGDSDFLVKMTFCRSNILNKPGRMWFLSQLSKVSIPFMPAYFPHGFLPPPAFEDATLSDTPSMLELPYSAPLGFSSTINPSPSPLSSLLLSTPGSPSIYPASAPYMFSFGDDILWPLSLTVVSDSVTVFEALEESHEVVTGNPTSTNAHGELTMISGISHFDLVIFKEGQTEITVGWQSIASRETDKYRGPIREASGYWMSSVKANPDEVRTRNYRIWAVRRQRWSGMINQQGLRLCMKYKQSLLLFGWFHYTKSKLRKVMKGAMTPLTNFCDKGESSKQQVIVRLVELLNSECLVNVQAAILELVDHQVFAELLWTLMLMPISGLADERQSARVADFFAEDICTSTKCLAQNPVCYLLILRYNRSAALPDNADHFEETLGKDRHKELMIFRDHKVMHNVLMDVLSPMYDKPHLFPQFTQAVTRLSFIKYENVLHFDPKTQLPRTVGKTKMLKTITNVQPIEESDPEGVHTNGLPNNNGFQYLRSLTDVFCFIADFQL